MKTIDIIFPGTSAADCKAASNNNKSHKFFSSAVINGELLIDFGPDIFEAAAAAGVSLSDIKYIINTHRHSDHFSTSALKELCAGGAKFFVFSYGETKEIGPYRITAFKGNHGTCENTAHFLIEDGKSSVYYALDGAWLLYEEISAIKKGIDLLVLDGTVGDTLGDYRIFEHNNLRMVEEILFTLKPYVGKTVISHIAPTLHKPQKELEQRMSISGIRTAFDGMKMTINPGGMSDVTDDRYHEEILGHGKNKR